jgi:RNA polymerase sigma factor (sigma-70 family)
LRNDEEEQSVLMTLPDMRPPVEDLAEAHELGRALAGAIQTLPSRFRAVFILRHICQLTFPEIGQRLKIPEATAKTYCYRACIQLRSRLKD